MLDLKQSKSRMTVEELRVIFCGNLRLNQSCFVNDQCLGLPYASCLVGKYYCIKKINKP